MNRIAHNSICIYIYIWFTKMNICWKKYLIQLQSTKKTHISKMSLNSQNTQALSQDGRLALVFGPQADRPWCRQGRGRGEHCLVFFLGLQINSKQFLVQFPGAFLKLISHRDRRIIDHTLTTDLLVGQVEIWLNQIMLKISGVGLTLPSITWLGRWNVT